MMMMPERRIHS